MKLFFKDKKFHVLNMNTGKFIFHCNCQEEAESKAAYYTGTSGSPHVVLSVVKIATQVKSITLTELT